MVQFKKCKLFDKTFEKANAQIKERFKEFVIWKSEHPNENFGKSDYAFTKAGSLSGFYHAKLNRDISIIYKRKQDIFYLYGIFDHEESGTGTPGNQRRQDALSTKLNNQDF